MAPGRRAAPARSGDPARTARGAARPRRCLRSRCLRRRGRAAPSGSGRWRLDRRASAVPLPRRADRCARDAVARGACQRRDGPAAPAGTRRVGSKVFMIEGLDVESGEWESPVGGQRYSEFQAGVQLANRTGALNEIEYSEFVQRVQAFAEAIGARRHPRHARGDGACARARRLRGPARCAARGESARACAAWSVGYIQQHARRHGFVPGMVPGRLVYPGADDGAPPVLMLTFDSQAALADEPRRRRGARRHAELRRAADRSAAEPFAAWQAAAQALAVGMDADVVDDNGRLLDTEGFTAIGGARPALRRARGARPGRRVRQRRGVSSAERRAARRGAGRVEAIRGRPPQLAVAPRRCGPSCIEHAEALLRARRAADSGRRVRQAVPGAAVDRGRASRAADAGLADPARDRRGARELAPVRHAVPMLSINTETDTTPAGAEKFDARVRKALKLADASRRWPTAPRLKFDGLAINLRYEHGSWCRPRPEAMARPERT